MDALLPEGELLTTKEVARTLRLSPGRVTELVRQGQLRSIQLGRRGSHRFAPDEVIRFVREGPLTE